MKFRCDLSSLQIFINLDYSRVEVAADARRRG